MMPHKEQKQTDVGRYKQGICNYFLFSLLVLFFIPTASAFTYINLYVDESGTSIFIGETDSISLPLPEGVRIDERGQILGRTNEITNKQGDIWTFKYTLFSAEMNIIFPEGTTILNISNPGAIISLEGKRISVFAKDSIEINYKIEDNNTLLSKLPLVLVLTGILIVLIVFLINYSRREKNFPEKNENKNKEDHNLNFLKLLNERERLIIKKLRETGKVKSSYLRKLLNIPKASFSRHVQELEKKRLVKRSGDGKNKILELVVK